MSAGTAGSLSYSAVNLFSKYSNLYVITVPKVSK